MKTKTVVIAVSVALVLSTCSAMNGIGQMMVDAGEVMMDAGNGNAQTNTPAKVLTADTDLSRQEGGLLRLTTVTEVVAGPVVVTDLFANNRDSSSSEAHAWLSTTACTGLPPPQAIELGGYHVSRLFVRAGERLCASAFGSQSLSWAGFRPY